MQLLTVTPDPAHEPLLEAFHRGIYADAFAGPQREPLDAWRRGLRGEQPYHQTIRLALEGGEVVAGISYERYPRSGCGLVTYMVVAPRVRRAGLGRRLQAEAAAELFAAGAAAVFGEVDDPRPLRGAAADVAWARLERNQRWGARVLGPPARYVQPELGPGLGRDRGLLLIALAGPAPLPAALDGALPRRFAEELYAATEGGPPDAEVAFPDRVPLIELHRT